MERRAKMNRIIRVLSAITCEQVYILVNVLLPGTTVFLPWLRASSPRRRTGPCRATWTACPTCRAVPSSGPLRGWRGRPSAVAVGWPGTVWTRRGGPREAPGRAATAGEAGSRRSGRRAATEVADGRPPAAAEAAPSAAVPLDPTAAYRRTSTS